jgi:hypothetical protein
LSFRRMSCSRCWPSAEIAVVRLISGILAADMQGDHAENDRRYSVRHACTVLAEWLI